MGADDNYPGGPYEGRPARQAPRPRARKPPKVVIHPEHLRPGRVLQVKDLGVLRMDFYWRGLATEWPEPTFTVQSEGIPQRFTPSTESGHKWHIVSSCGVGHMLSLNGVRRWFTLPEGATI